MLATDVVAARSVMKRGSKSELKVVVYTPFVTVPALPPMLSVDVAMADGTPEALEMLPRTELAAIDARPMVPETVMVPPVSPLLVAIEVTVPVPLPLGVVVAITTPEAFTARNVPAGVARDERVGAFVNV
jgi:hypothetical protein